MRLRFGFSPLASRECSVRGVASAALRVASRRSSCRIATPLPSKLSTSHVIRRFWVAKARGVKLVEVLRRTLRQLLDLSLGYARPRPLVDPATLARNDPGLLVGNDPLT